jgi:hypothetical protein
MAQLTHSLTAQKRTPEHVNVISSQDTEADDFTPSFLADIDLKTIMEENERNIAADNFKRSSRGGGRGGGRVGSGRGNHLIQD